MSTTVRLAAFAVGTVAAFGAAFGVGRVVGPIGDDGPPAHEPGHSQPTDSRPTNSQPTDTSSGEGSDPSHPSRHGGGQP